MNYARYALLILLCTQVALGAEQSTAEKLPEYINTAEKLPEKAAQIISEAKQSVQQIITNNYRLTADDYRASMVAWLGFIASTFGLLMFKKGVDQCLAEKSIVKSVNPASTVKGVARSIIGFTVLTMGATAILLSEEIVKAVDTCLSKTPCASAS